MNSSKKATKAKAYIGTLSGYNRGNQMETIKCEMCSAAEAVRFLDSVNENGEVCEDCFGEVYDGHAGYD